MAIGFVHEEDFPDMEVQPEDEEVWCCHFFNSVTMVIHQLITCLRALFFWGQGLLHALAVYLEKTGSTVLLIFVLNNCDLNQ